MNESVKKTQTPEEYELELKLRELDRFEDVLLTKETDLETLRTELQILEKRYLNSVGRKFAELDKLEKKIADLLVRNKPEKEESANAFEENKDIQNDDECFEEKIHEKDDFHVSDDLKKLYRDIAKRVHPDLTTDPEEKKIREKYMSEVNKAYKERNRNRLLELLQQWMERPESIKEDDIGSRLVRIIRQISLVKKKINQLDAEYKDLMESQIYKLKIKHEEYEEEGKNLFKEMIERIDVDIEKAKIRLEELLVKRESDKNK
ncbi:MAG: hypothetical protein AB7V07_01930 [Candidatus Delongbacteria bacterium]